MDDFDNGATVRGMAVGQNVFGRYQLKRILGRGGMGIVWAAWDLELGRETALKFLPDSISSDRSAIHDLKREVRRAIDLAHPHIVKTHDFVTDQKHAAVSMELVEGQTLSSLRLDQSLEVFSAADLAGWVSQLCDALTYAHEDIGIVHRDLKPMNLMVDQRNRLKILDFGIAASLSESATRLSKASGTSGTPLYMSPQQMLGEKPTVTDDIYSFGATLYELLTGKAPFFRGQIELQVLNQLPAGIEERRHELGVVEASPVPVHWEAAIKACLAKEPSDRPQSFRDLDQLLQQSTVSGRSAPSSPPTSASTSTRTPRKNLPLLFSTALTIVVLGVAVVWWTSNENPRPLAENTQESSSPIEQEGNEVAVAAAIETSSTTQPASSPETPTNDDSSGAPSPTSVEGIESESSNSIETDPSQIEPNKESPASVVTETSTEIAEPRPSVVPEPSGSPPPSRAAIRSSPNNDTPAMLSLLVHQEQASLPKILEGGIQLESLTAGPGNSIHFGFTEIQQLPGGRVMELALIEMEEVVANAPEFVVLRELNTRLVAKYTNRRGGELFAFEFRANEAVQRSKARKIPGYQGEEVIAALQKMAKQFNVALPLKLDQVTVHTSVQVGNGNELVYHYQITDRSINRRVFNNAAPGIKVNFIRNLHTDQSFINVLRQLGSNIRLNYTGPNGDVVGEIVIRSNEIVQ